jgi:hypothetical protein
MAEVEEVPTIEAGGGEAPRHQGGDRLVGMLARELAIIGANTSWRSS